MKNKPLKPGRTVLLRTWALLALCGFVAFGTLVFKLFDVQIQNSGYYRQKAADQQLKSFTIPAARGTIFASNGQILAQSATAWTVHISPLEMSRYEQDAELIASGLSAILGDKGDDYETILRKSKLTGSLYQAVARKIEPDMRLLVEEFKAEHELRGVYTVEDTKRYYPAGNIASQIIGFVGAENKGLYGIESYYETMLRGISGSSSRLTNERGSDLLFEQYENNTAATQGNNLILTIDATLQNYLEKHLLQAIVDNQILNGAMGIIMEVDTGAILAAASLPDFDPNSYNTLNESANTYLKAIYDMGKSKESVANIILHGGLVGLIDASNIEPLGLTMVKHAPTWEGDPTAFTDEERSFLLGNAVRAQWKPRQFSDTYEPGSTFKIITLASALDAGAINANDSFYCGGSMNVLGRTNPLNCWKHAGHGSQTLAEAAQHSCNVAFVNIGLTLGAEKFYDYIEAFGLRKPTGLDITGEGDSIWWDNPTFMDPNNKSQLASASFGQTFNITPLQMITAVSAVANGGNLMEPYLVEKITAPDGTVLKNTQPTIVRQVISEQTSQICREILESVVAEQAGTGKNARVPGYRIAGKTGTSEKVGQDSDEYVVSFVGFAPADDPKIAVLILLDTPSRNSGIYISGGVMAAPVVGNIFADALPYLGIDPIQLGDMAASSAVMPNTKSKTTAEAFAVLQDAGLTPRIFGNGDTIIDQAPFANTILDPGSQVILYTDTYKPDQTVVVPNLFGKTYKEAKAALEPIGLFIRAVGVNADGGSKIAVARQEFEAGTEVAYGTVVEVTLIDNDTSLMEVYT